MLGLGLDLASRRTARQWWQAGLFPATNLATGSKALPALIADMPRNLQAITTVATASVAAAPPASLSLMNTALFSDLFAFSRAGSATFRDASGLLQTAASGVPRFDYSNGRRQLLLEGAATNLCTWSQDWTNASWAKTNCTIAANTATAPDGSLTADKLVETTTPMVQHAASGFYASFVAGTAYTFSLHVKAAERSRLCLAFSSAAFSGFAVVDINLQTLATASIGGTAAIAAVRPVGDGWLRVSITATATTSSSATFWPMLHNGTSDLYTGDGTSGLFIWGAQLEAGPVMSSYIPTGSSAASRAADSARFSPKAEALLQRTACSILVKGQGLAANQPIAGVGLRMIGAASQSRILGTNGAGTAAMFGNSSVIVSGSFSFPLPAFGTAAAWNPTGKALSHAGSVASTDAIALDATLTQCFLGRDDTEARANGWYDQICIYPFRVSNSELQRLAQAYA